MPRLDESLLTHLPPFLQLDRSEIREILDQAMSRRYDKETSVFDEGDKAEFFHLLLDGYLRVLRTTENGDQVILLHIASGQLFGFAQAVGRTTYPATAMAVSECIVLSWPMRLWSDFTAKYVGFAENTYASIGKRLNEVNSRVVDLSTLQVEQRVAKVLLRLMNQSGRRTATGIEIDFPVSRQDIAEMTGTTLHTVSRLLSAWAKDGIVESGRKRITVVHAHSLVVIAEGGEQG